MATVASAAPTGGDGSKKPKKETVRIDLPLRKNETVRLPENAVQRAAKVRIAPGSAAAPIKPAPAAVTAAAAALPVSSALGHGKAEIALAVIGAAAAIAALSAGIYLSMPGAN